MNDTAQRDWFLVIIVVGIVLLVIAALVMATLRGGRPVYQPDDTPAGVAFNYLLALQQQDYERAYRYLSPSLPGYPDSLEAFVSDITPAWRPFDQQDVALNVEATRLVGDTAIVTFRETVFRRGGLFNSGQYSNTFRMTLRREEGTWKIVNSERYWQWQWSQQPEMKARPPL